MDLNENTINQDIVNVNELKLKKMSKKRNNSLTVISDGKFNIGCSTKTYIAKLKTKQSFGFGIEDLLNMLESSYQTKFRNCVLKKKNTICIKLYSNLTIQVTGVKSIDGFIDIVNEIKYPNDSLVKSEYNLECVMSNWTVILSLSQIDLNKTMLNLNQSGILAYFLCGYPLIVKYKSKLKRPVYSFSNGKITGVEEVPITKPISILIFKSGSCIVSGSTEESAAECISQLIKYVVST
ncbi:hypothetical protein [Dasineura jujubifolia toursvirus 2a]|nr:hypothetical protein [Dasineura jujubifolia toursvirus 2a]